jgi:hypothetical protein
MDYFFAATGIHLQDVIAGFAGGVARALMPPFLGAWTALSSILLGTVTAAYLTEPVAGLLGDKISRGAVGFMVGVGAMVLVQGVMGALANLKVIGGHKDAA